MGFQIKMFIIIEIFFLMACAENRVNEKLPTPLSSVLPTPTPSYSNIEPNTDGNTNGLNGSIGTIGSIGSTDSPSNPESTAGAVHCAGIKCLTTSTGGTLILSNQSVLAVDKNISLKGFAADANQIYVLLEKDLGGGVLHWQIISRPHHSSQFSHVCEWLDDSKFFGGLSVDQDSFWILGQHYPISSTYRRFAKSDCSETESIATGQNRDGLTGASSFSLLGNSIFNFYSPKGPQNSSIALGLMNRDTNKLSLLPENLKFGSKAGNMQANFSHSVAATESNIWVTLPDLDNYEHFSLWKLSTTGSVVGWAQLPVRAMPESFAYIENMAAVDSNHLVMAKEFTDRYGNKSINFSYLNVSRF